jgi:sarcosine oxidase subunit alpha
MHEWHERHGAKIAEVAGWKRVVDYGDLKAEVTALHSAAGLLDATPISKIDVQGKQSGEMLDRFTKVPGIGECTAAVLSCSAGLSAYAARLTRDRFIVLGGVKQRAEIYSSLSDAGSGDDCVHVTDLTSAYAALQLIGPMSKNLLKKLGPAQIDSMKNDSCQQSPLARVVALLIRRDVREVPGWLILVSRDYGEYVWECVLAAGHEFGIRPFGIQAEKILMDAEAADVEVV